MALPLDFVPKKPFADFKWKWACLQCTEGLNDPVVLLGVLFRMRKLELANRGIKYNSQALRTSLSPSRTTSRIVESASIWRGERASGI